MVLTQDLTLDSEEVITTLLKYREVNHIDIKLLDTKEGDTIEMLLYVI